ncbi:MAG: hypothetical protein A2010_14950 [Nitrospirae bacterium GWD2_57_9]|nr:MAG: hypothetical protein A2010_14950 [Nitrospirae bacterium GWD2_57_9]OGW50226.1 MAG: hypothetical protein A2078_03935 [Nitrospirae bacterium GWC2_57_9]
MNIIDKIKQAFGRGPLLSQDQISRFSLLPKDQARKEFCDTAYELCAKRAAEFVKRELGRADSPYQGLSSAALYHEILVVTFWLMDKAAADGKNAFLDDLHEHYFRSHSAPEGSREERQKGLSGKYEQYEDFWNEITGHFDEFGLCVVRNLFGTGESSRTRERTFWIIQYADETIQAFSPLRKVSKKLFSLPPSS